MNYLILWTRLLFLMAHIGGYAVGSLSPTGKNVCLKTEKYTELIETREKIPVKKWEKTWCMSPSKWFRCDEEHISYKFVTVKKPQSRTKIVATCCVGYVENSKSTECIPFCRRGCANGVCYAPDTCDCPSGFYGSQCEEVCPSERWGKNCINVCKCLNEAYCDRVSGECICKPGWQGTKCEVPCPDGYYGFLCKEVCHCKKNICDHVTGSCFSETTTVTSTEREGTSFEGETEKTEESTSFRETNISMSTKREGTSFEDETEKCTNFSETTTVISTEKKDTSFKGEAEENEERTSLSSSIDSALTEMTNIPTAETPSIILSTDATTLLTNVPTIETFQEKKAYYSELNRGLVLNDTRVTEKMSGTTEHENGEKVSSETLGRKNGNIDYEPEVTATTSTSKTTTESFWTDNDNAIEDTMGINEESIDRIMGGEEDKSGVIHFIPSLSVLSGVSVLLFLIAAKWLLSRKRKKFKQKALEDREMCCPEERRDSFFLVNNFTENPVYMSDVENTCTAPVLRTFKPILNDEPKKIS